VKEPEEEKREMRSSRDAIKKRTKKKKKKYKHKSANAITKYQQTFFYPSTAPLLPLPLPLSPHPHGRGSPPMLKKKEEPKSPKEGWNEREIKETPPRRLMASLC
jgi:hypothetical protein